MDSRRNTDPLPIFLKRLMKARGMTVGKLWLAAGLEGVRLHDLRHTVGASGADAGLSMLEIQAILGHSQVSTTERYSHLSRSAAHRAADKVSGAIAAALEIPAQSADVIDMQEHRRRKSKS